MAVLLLVAGLTLLIVGAEALVRGAAQLAGRLGLPPLVIGLTVVSFGTSAPELAVGVGSALEGQPGLALGNVVGSNIANVLLILGVSALVAPLVVKRQLVRLDVPLMILLSIATFVLAANGVLDRVDGLLLVAAAVGYTGWTLYNGRRDGMNGVVEDVPKPRGPWPLDLVLQAVGLGLLVLGARWLISGAVGIASALGLSELVIGLTIVAAGTSLPELAISVVAVMRGQRDIAVGNVVGSNIANLVIVLGVTSAVAPIPVPDGALSFDLPVMVAVAIACLPVFFTRMAIRRWEGALFIGYYVAYLAYVFLDSAGHDALEPFNLIMLTFVIPLTLITLITTASREINRRRETHPRQ
jgi:cation:H+ antiporter